MKQQVTRGIVLARINYGESDRIITVITSNYGKLRLIAKGARKVKSKLAGGIELFSVIEASFISGRGEIGTLVSARLEKFYGNVIKDIKRVQLGYDILKTINKNTEDNAEDDYFLLTKKLLEKLDNFDISADLIRLWFEAQILKLNGHTPNLKSDDRSNTLKESHNYSFDLDRMCFAPSDSGRFNQQHIKFLRLLFGQLNEDKIFSLVGAEKIETEIKPILEAMFRSYISL